MLWQTDQLNRLGDLSCDFFLAHERLRTVLLHPLRAMQIVVSLLRLGRDERAAFSTPEYSAVEVRLELWRPRFGFVLEHLLAAVEETLGDKRLVFAFTGFAAI